MLVLPIATYTVYPPSVTLISTSFGNLYFPSSPLETSISISHANELSFSCNGVGSDPHFHYYLDVFHNSVEAVVSTELPILCCTKSNEVKLSSYSL